MRERGRGEEADDEGGGEGGREGRRERVIERERGRGVERKREKEQEQQRYILNDTCVRRERGGIERAGGGAKTKRRTGREVGVGREEEVS